MTRKATTAQLKAARADPRQLCLLPAVSCEELDAIRTVLAVASDQIDRIIIHVPPEDRIRTAE